MLARVLLLLLAFAVLGLTGRTALGDEPKFVALVVATPAGASKADQQLIADLVGLVKQLVETDPRFLPVQWSPSPATPQPPIPPKAFLRAQGENKPRHPDLFLIVDVLPSGDETQPLWARLRVVDRDTRAVRGVTVARLDEGTIEETARQFSQYLAIVTGTPQRPALTVAVAPLENVDRSDALRPLQCGLQDLIAAQLLVRSGATLAGGYLPEDHPEISGPPESRGTFQVLRRPNLEELRAQIDRIQSVLPEKGEASSELPSREGSYLIRGEIQQRDAGPRPTVVVRGEMLQAATGQAVGKFAFESSAAELDRRLAAEIDRLVALLPADAKIPLAAPAATGSALHSLRNLAMADLHRLQETGRRRLRSEHFWTGINLANLSSPDFAAPKKQSRFPSPLILSDALHDIRTLVERQTPPGRHLLRQSIDRLETILFVTPDDLDVMLALGFCYSLPEKETFQPARADALLRKAYELGETADALIRERRLTSSVFEFAPPALEYLAQIGYDNSLQELASGERIRAIERIEFALDHMPEGRQARSDRLLEFFATLRPTAEETGPMLAFLPKFARFAEQATGPQQGQARTSVMALIARLARESQNQPALHGLAIDLLTQWATSDDEHLADVGLTGLGLSCVESEDYLIPAALYEKSAAKVADLDSTHGHRRHVLYLTRAAENYRKANQPGRGLELLLPLADDSGPQPLVDGYRGYEVGACYEALARPHEALAAYIRAAENCPALIPNADIADRIAALGGVPLRPDRVVDVQYFPRPANLAPSRNTLATDGGRLYMGDATGVYAFEIASQTWKPLKTDLGAVTCLVCRDQKLWVGTDQGGVWQCDLGTETWTQTADVDSLPNPHVESLAIDGDAIYLGVGTQVTGRLVRIDGQGQVQVFTEELAPHLSPTQIVITKTSLLVSTRSTVHQWSFETGGWLPPSARPKGGPNHARLFQGKHAVWASAYGHELFRWGEAAEDNAIFARAWYPPGHGRSGYAINFVAERGKYVWFGGQPREPFASSGLYRMNLANGALDNFGPADGFRGCQVYSVYDALWLDDRLWLTTSEGLCAVKERK